MKTRILFTLMAMILCGSCTDFTSSDRKRNSGNGLDKPGSGKPANPFTEEPVLNEGEFSEEKMILNIGLRVAYPLTRRFYAESLKLRDAIDLKCDGNRIEEQFRKTTLAFHELVGAASFGPLAANQKLLHNRIYPWPTVDFCGIDKLVMNPKTDTQQILFTRLGLTAIEYLLFEPSLTAKCNPRAVPESAKWNALPETKRRKDRCQAARRLSKILEADAQSLLSDWDPKQANYTKSMIDGSVFSNIKEATNSISDGLFNIEEDKNLRLGKPLGKLDCFSDSGICPEAVEHPFAKLSTRALLAHLKGFRALYSGQLDGSDIGFGFEEFLISKNRSDLAQTMLRLTDEILAKTEQLVSLGPLDQIVNAMDARACKETTSDDRKVEICALHSDIQNLDLKLKADLLTALSLRRPPPSESDAD